MKLWKNYHLAASVEDALHVLSVHGGRAQIVAGGTDLLLDIQQGNHPTAEMLVDITRIPEMHEITIDDNRAIIGAGVTHSTIESHAVLRARAACLTESCGVVGGPQVRNVATIGGNVAHALPAADGTLSLVALRAEAEVASPGSQVWQPIPTLFAGAGKSTINPCAQLLTRFRVPLTGPGEASAFKRIMRPQGVALPILGCAVWIKLDELRSTIIDASICLGPVAPTPARNTEIEQALIGQPATSATIDLAARAGRETLHPRSSKYRATAEYRTEMIEVLLHDALTTALERVNHANQNELIG